MIKVPSVPAESRTLRALLDAEIRSFVRGSRTLVWTAAVPLLILILGELAVPKAFAHNPLPTFEIASVAVTTGIFALGLFGYATVLAGYRDRGVFQRLRCTPTPHWQLLAARMIAQLIAVAVQAVLVYAAMTIVYGAVPSAAHTALSAAAVLLGGLAALALGQAIVALVASTAAVTAMSRLLLIPLFVLEGVFVRTSTWPQWLQQTSNWTPVRIVTRLLEDALVQGSWNGGDLRYLVGLLAWIILLAYIGLGRFRWDSA